MSEQTVQFADVFPELDAHKTKDPRIFVTAWEYITKKSNYEFGGAKVKKYFACLTNGSCYGVDVIREVAVDARKECDEAFTKVKEACDFVETNGTWPPSDKKE